MTKTRDLANLVSGSNPLVDGVIDYSEITNTPAPFDPATLASVAVSGSYADLGGKPALATVATSGSFTDLSNQPTPFDPATLASVATTGAYADVTGTPTLAAVATNGAYSSLSGTPTLAAVATSGAYSSLSGVPALAAVATSGSYADLSNKPSTGVATGTSFPTGSEGQLFYRTDQDLLYAYNSTKTIWEVITIQAGYTANTVQGHALFTTGGTYTWTVPSGVNVVCILCIGAGGSASGYDRGGGGGGLSYKNSVIVVPGTEWNITVGASVLSANGGLGLSSRVWQTGSNIVCEASGGKGGPAADIKSGGTYTIGDGGGTGGTGGFNSPPNYTSGGGGGAAGYTGNGGQGAGTNGAGSTVNGTSGSGGGGGGGGSKGSSNGYAAAAGGGGVGLYGLGANGAGGAYYLGPNSNDGAAAGGGGGSGGGNGYAGQYYTQYGYGGLYGGGAGSNGAFDVLGGIGAVRIVWKTGSPLSFYFPSTNIGA